MSKKELKLILTIFVMWILGVATGLAINQPQEPSLKGLTGSELTYAICQGSRISDTYTEEQCGDVMNFTRFEYLCEDRNKLTTNTCWVEKVDNYVELIGQE